jgi:hypothetical protein
VIQNLILFQKLYDFALWLDPVIRGFSRAHRYSLGSQIQKETLELMKSVIRGNLSRAKQDALADCVVHYEILIALVRLANDLRGSGTLSAKQYEYAAARLDEVGRLLAGWRRRFA